MSKKKKVIVFLVFIFIANLLLLLANLPRLIRIIRTPADRIAPIIHDDVNPLDYYQYLSAIKQGQNNYLLYHDPYTVLETKPGFFYLNYLLIGRLSNIFHLTTVVAYHIFNLIFFEFFAVFLFLLSCSLLGLIPGLWASIFALIITVNPTQPVLVNQWHPYPNWWVYFFDALERLYTVPHNMLGNLLLLLSVCIFLLFLKRNNIKYILFSGIVLFAAGLTHPSSLFPFAFALPIAYILFHLRNFISRKKTKFKPGVFFGILYLFFIIALCFFLYKYQASLGFPWDPWLKEGLSRWNRGVPDFNNIIFTAFGYLALIGLPAALKIIYKGSVQELFIVFWAYLPFYILPFANLLGVPKIRVLQEAPFVPLGILIAFAIFNIIPNIKKNILRITAVLIIMFISLPFSLNIVAQKTSLVNNEPFNIMFYIPESNKKAMDFIDLNIKKNSVFLTGTSQGAMLPAFSLMKVYFGHMHLTPVIWEKEVEALDFYTKKMSFDQAKDFLDRSGIEYVYLGPYERERYAVKSLDYPFITPIYNNEEVIIYKLI